MSMVSASSTLIRPGRYDLKTEITKSPVSRCPPELLKHPAAQSRQSTAMKRRAAWVPSFLPRCWTDRCRAVTSRTELECAQLMLLYLISQLSSLAVL